MTVIAWDGMTLAADKRALTGGAMHRTTTKIEQHGDALLAVTGGWDVGIELREWWKAGAKPSDFPPKARDDVATLIVIRPGAVVTYASGPYPLPMEGEKFAFGSGRDFAEAAMYCGKTAAEAVAVACHFQSDCGNGIDVLTPNVEGKGRKPA